MPRVKHFAALAWVASSLISSCVLPPAAVSPNGRLANVSIRNGLDHKGELLASTADSLWLQVGGEVQAFPMEYVHSVTVERHPFDAKRTFAWAAGIGAATGVALTIACTQVKDTSCGPVIPVFTGFFTAVGSLFAISNDHSSDFRFSVQDSSRMRAFARFPQGMPPSLAPSGVVMQGKP